MSDKPAEAAKPTFASLIKTPQFPWFIGHVLVLVGSFFYMLCALRVFRSPGFPIFWYRLVYVAAMATFGLTLKELYSKKVPTAVQIANDDNVHYLLVSFLWLISKPSVFTLIPFSIFSLVHVITYVRTSIFPIVGRSPDTGIGAQMKSFVATYNEPLLKVAASIELFLLFSMLPQAFTFKKGALFPFIMYLLFVKVRFDQSFHMRQAVKNLEVKIDNLVSNPNLPPVVKQGWVQFKLQLAKGLSIVSFKPAASPAAKKS